MMLPRRGLRSLGGGLALAAVAALLAGCAASPSGAVVELGADTVVVDVRTPTEFASGHLEDAVNIDFQSSEFASQISELDEDLDYVVYCQTGNRSAQAVAQMKEQGLSVQDAGGVDEAAQATGLEIVR
ncbi:rhodanese-like domain-containing protein [Microbacterium sp. C448]|uniref:rhodanese-like domain-containing protein n=1 Tax=Microbacterium sp. C448 TaxID=1177594 RepID=UPI00068737CE|nr:rhodanese-like domain-containing protein [Microbacterium sp. C448]